MSDAAPFWPTHRVPTTGMATWAAPDAAQPPGPALAADLPVAVDERLGEWARIRCSNGWEAWVDARQLVAGGAPAGPIDDSPIRVGSIAVTMPLVGAAVAGIGVLILPWLSQLGVTQSAWKVPVKFLLDPKITNTDGPKIAWVVLPLAAAGAWLTLNPVSRQLRKVIGWALVLLPTIFVTQIQRQMSEAQQGGFATGSVFSILGMGVFATAVGGLLIALGKGQET